MRGTVSKHDSTPQGRGAEAPHDAPHHQSRGCDPGHDAPRDANRRGAPWAPRDLVFCAALQDKALRGALEDKMLRGALGDKSYHATPADQTDKGPLAAP